MKAILWVLAALTALFGLMVLGGAKSAVHEILAAVSFLISAVMVGSAAICSALDKVRQAVEANRDTAS